MNFIVVRREQCPLCGKYVLPSDYDHEFYIQSGQIKCTGQK